MGEIRFVGTGETSGYPYLVYKKFQVVFIILAVQNMFFGKQVSFRGQSVHITVLKFSDTKKKQNVNLSRLRYDVLGNIM